MRERGIGGFLAFAGALVAIAAPARAAAPYVVQPGETLWSIAAAHNLTTRTIAAYNGLPENALLISGTTVHVPTVDEGAAALASGVPAVSSPVIAGGVEADANVGGEAASASETEAATASSTAGDSSSALTTIAPAPGMGHIPSPSGELHLIPAAADAWNAMRQEALEVFGIDIHPGGPVSAYRTYEQQAELYRLFLAGVGEPANPPGTSSHERGTAVDVATPEIRWVIDQIGWKHGWSKVHGPGEWWHVGYVGG
jgi:LysM repeat protein